MKKIFLLLFTIAVLFVSEISAAGIRFVENKTWNEILAQAKREKKLIFLDAYATWCGPCKYLQKNVFTDDEVGTYYNSTFINVKMDMEKGEGIELAERYEVTSYPTLFFINGDGQLVHKSIGALETNEFITLGKTAVNPEKQYFTLKEKAKQGKLNPEAFHTWVHAAEAMEDKDAASIINSYINSATYPVMDEEMLAIVMDHGTLTGKKQIDELFSKRKTAAGVLDLTEEEYNEKLAAKIVNFGLKQLVTDKIDFTQFHKMINAYYPEKSRLETQKAKVHYYQTNENARKLMSELAILIKDPSYGLRVDDMAALVMDATEMIVEEKGGADFVSIVKGYKLRSDDKDKVYYKDLAIAVLYLYMQDYDNLEVYVKKITSNEETPEFIIEFLSNLMEE